MSDQRVLVVGATPDYVAHIEKRYPGRVLFLTDHAVRDVPGEAAPVDIHEVTCDLLDSNGALHALRLYLEETHQSLSGVACFDCEWLSLAAELADHFGLPFPSAESVGLSRNKFLTKRRWAENAVRCPQVELVHTGWQSLQIIEQFRGPVVFKPTTGSGSELTFLCNDKYDVTVAYRAIKSGLATRSQSPLYRLNPEHGSRPDADLPVLAEEWVEGREYSADFVIEDNTATLIRVAKKLRSDSLPFGTTLAYVVPAKLPGLLNAEMLREKLREAATALGFGRAVCMVDFIVNEDKVTFLELTPRIGGDCLPPLIRESCGLDTIGLALDFAGGRKLEVPSPDRWTELVGMRLFAPRSGMLANVNCIELSEDPRVREIVIQRAPGHEIIRPPEDYDSWLLGHVIFEPTPGVRLVEQCHDIREKIAINVEQHDDQKATWHDLAGRPDVQPPGPAA